LNEISQLTTLDPSFAYGATVAGAAASNSSLQSMDGWGSLNQMLATDNPSLPILDYTSLRDKKSPMVDTSEAATDQLIDSFIQGTFDTASPTTTTGTIPTLQSSPLDQLSLAAPFTEGGRRRLSSMDIQSLLPSMPAGTRSSRPSFSAAPPMQPLFAGGIEEEPSIGYTTNPGASGINAAQAQAQASAKPVRNRKRDTETERRRLYSQIIRLLYFLTPPDPSQYETFLGVDRVDVNLNASWTQLRRFRVNRLVVLKKTLQYVRWLRQQEDPTFVQPRKSAPNPFSDDVGLGTSLSNSLQSLHCVTTSSGRMLPHDTVREEMEEENGEEQTVMQKLVDTELQDDRIE
jgi:hypothetical protein